MKYQTILLKKFFGLKGAVYYEAIATVIFSRVKISSFRANAHVVFHYCLCNKLLYKRHFSFALSKFTTDLKRL